MTDQNYTIAKIIGDPKTYGDKTRIAFTCNETGETIHSMFTKFPGNVKPGAQVWGHLEEQEKDGKTYSNFFFGKDNPNKKGGMSEADKAKIANLENKLTSLTLVVNRVVLALQDKEILERPKQTIAGTEVDYPQSTGGTAFDEEEDFDPFGDSN